MITFKAHLLDNKSCKHLLVVRIAVTGYLAIFLARHSAGDKSRVMVNQKAIVFHAFVRCFSENGQCLGKKGLLMTFKRLCGPGKPCDLGVFSNYLTYLDQIVSDHR